MVLCGFPVIKRKKPEFTVIAMVIALFITNDDARVTVLARIFARIFEG